LRAAVSSGNEKLVSLLLQRENRAPAAHGELCRAMVAAVQAGRPDLLKMLDSVLVEETGKSWTQFETVKDVILCEASSHGHVDMVWMLLDNGAGVSPRSAFSKSILRGPALHVATARGYTDIA